MNLKKWKDKKEYYDYSPVHCQTPHVIEYNRFYVSLSSLEQVLPVDAGIEDRLTRIRMLKKYFCSDLMLIYILPF